MNYPFISEYIDAIKAAEDNFDELSTLRPVYDENRQPVMSSGNYAVVFKMKDEQTGKLYAVKCFLKEQEGRAEAYRLISEELENVSSPYITSVKYLDKELYVDTNASEETEFPVLLMDWVEGNPMDTYIDLFKKDVYKIHSLFGDFVKMALWLLSQPFAHGDLKPDNILVRDDGKIVLVDYDGMFVPAMKGQEAREVGSPDFQHPSRNTKVFSDNIDIFALSSIAMSLSYIARLIDLNEYQDNESFFLRETDIQKLSESKLFQNIQNHSRNTICGKMLSIFNLSYADINVAKEIIVFLYSSIVNNNTEISSFDKDNSFEVDDIFYSFDGKKIVDTHYCEDSVLEIREGVETLCDYSLLYKRYKIIQLPSTLKFIGLNALPDGIQLFISDSPFFVVGECGLFSSDRKELIKCHSYFKKSILPLFPETILIRNEAYKVLCSSFYAVKENNYYQLTYNVQDDYVIVKDIDGPLYEDKYGAIYSKDNKALLYFPINSEIREYSILDGCERLEEFSFVSDVSVCAGGHGDVDISTVGNNIETLHFPNSLKTIGKDALLGCVDLRNIFIDINKEDFFMSLLEDYYRSDGGCFSFNSPLVENLFLYETKPSAEDESNYIEDELGFRYSKDGLKLICGNHTEAPYSIREGVKIICDSAFYLVDCPNLVLPDSLVSIGDYSFADFGYGSEEFIVPANVRSIGSGAFLGEGYVSIKILGKVQYMGSHVFSPDDNGSRLKNVELSEGVLDLGDLTFDGCYNLKSIVLPSTLISMGDNPFANSGIEEVHNNSEWFTIQDGCVYRMWSDKLISYYGKHSELVFDYIFEVGNYAFAGNQFIQSILFKKKTLTIGEHAFDHCTNLISISLPQTLQIIKETAFQGCSRLESIVIPPKVFEISNYTFNACSSLHNVILPKYLLKIGLDAFMQCPSLSYVQLPSYLQEIIGNPFHKDYSGNGVQHVDCLSNEHFHVYMGGLYHNLSKTLVAVFSAKDRFVIEEGTLCIGDSAFIYCNQIKTIKIPSSVIKIGDFGFWGCERLEYVILGQNIKEISHPNSMFEFCKLLQHIYIKDNNHLFDLLFSANKEYRNKLKKMEITTVLPDEEIETFTLPGEKYIYYDDNSRIVRYGDTYRGDYAIKEGTRVICDECFFNEYDEVDYYYLSNLYIPKSVEHIGKNPFCGSIDNIKCDSPFFIIDGSYLLTKDKKKLIFYFGTDKQVHIPEGIEVIGSGSFCSRKISELHIPSTILEIEDNPFISTHNVDDNFNISTTNIISHTCRFKIINNTLIDSNHNKIISYWGEDTIYIVPDDIKSIGANAFFGSHIEHMELPKTIEYIDETSLCWCFNLKEILIPKGTKYEMKKLLGTYLHSIIKELHQQ